MPIRAYFQFYKDVILYILIFTFICMLLFGIAAAFLIFTTLGIFIGFLVFELLNKEEYYFYYNLGITKWKLFKVVFLINLIIGTPIVLVLLLITSYFIGNTSII
ncbi:MAG: hypothetical protein COB12_08355 [Flavobacterium sp.]|nr:MAG: hypothetical protein COB12_08355 [Flavobacterium sp.]